MKVLVPYPESFVGAHLVVGLEPVAEVVIPAGDVRDPEAAREAFATHRPDVVVLDTPFAGGIGYNQQHPADLLVANLTAQLQVFREALEQRCRVLFVGSSCMYPRDVRENLDEDLLGTGGLEPTSAPYATAKLAGWQMATAWRTQYGAEAATLVPANLYGPGDDFDPASGHVISALMARMHAARQEGREAVVLWGTGRAERDFLHVRDFVRFVALAIRRELPWPVVNVGSGAGVSILELARTMRDVVGYPGRLETDPSRPDGAPRKVLASLRARSLGWRPELSLEEGLRDTWSWYSGTVAAEAAR